MEVLSYQQLAWIAGIEFLTLLLLIVLIVTRKIGKPLTEIQLEERRQKQIKKEQRRLLREQQWQAELTAYENQDALILSMQRPVTFVSLTGDDFEGRTLCVQDGLGKPHALHLPNSLLSRFHAFNSLYNAAAGPSYHGERGAVLLK